MIFRRKNTPALPAVGTPADMPAPPHAGAGADVRPRGSRCKKVLVVDDDPITLRALSTKLESEGYTVLTAIDGSEALSARRAERPDVVLLDVHFPPDVAHGGGVPWNGFLIAQWLRRLDDSRHTPVILISANDRAEYRQKASAVGAAAFLPKPIDSAVLLTSIETAVRRKPDAESECPVEPTGREPNTGVQNRETPGRFYESAGPGEDKRSSNPTIEFGI